MSLLSVLSWLTVRGVSGSDRCLDFVVWSVFLGEVIRGTALERDGVVGERKAAGGGVEWWEAAGVEWWRAAGGGVEWWRAAGGGVEWWEGLRQQRGGVEWWGWVGSSRWRGGVVEGGRQQGLSGGGWEAAGVELWEGGRQQGLSGGRVGGSKG